MAATLSKLTATQTQLQASYQLDHHREQPVADKFLPPAPKNLVSFTLC